MTISKNVDLEKAFDELKKDLREADQIQKTYPDPDHIGLTYAAAYGKLFADVQFFLFINTDTKAMQDILTDPEPVDDIPKELFTQQK